MFRRIRGRELKNLVPADELDIPRELTVCFTGHRAAKLPWGDDEEDSRCIEFKRRLEAEILKAHKKGAMYFLSGMADGVDIYAAETVLSLAAKYPDMKLIAVFPYGTGADTRAKRVAGRAFKTVSLHESYTANCFMERNLFLVKHSSRAICGFSGSAASGTGATIRMAMNAGLDVIIINI